MASVFDVQNRKQFYNQLDYAILLHVNQIIQNYLLAAKCNGSNSLLYISLPRFHLWYTVDRPPEGWKYSSGFINKEMCAAHLPPPSSDSMLFVCGPPPMIKRACEPAFKELGYEESQWFSF